MKAALIPQNGDPEISITREISLVGRNKDCDIQIEHPTISRRHCVLVRTAGLLVLRDLATLNGTKVKGQRVRWAALLPGDRITIGGYKVTVFIGPESSTTPLTRPDYHPAGVVTGFAPPTPTPIFNETLQNANPSDDSVQAIDFNAESRQVDPWNDAVDLSLSLSEEDLIEPIPLSLDDVVEDDSDNPFSTLDSSDSDYKFDLSDLD